MNEKSKCLRCPISGVPLRTIFAVIILTIVGSFSGWLVWGYLFNDVWSAPEFKNLWRPMDAKEWSFMPIASIIYAIFFTFLYCKFAKGKKCGGETYWGGGLIFGAQLWLVTGLMAGIWMYIIHPISAELAILTPIDNLITNVVGGAIVGKIVGCTSSKCES